MNLPTIKSYGDYSSNNYGLNSLLVSIGSLDLYFSYETIVAYKDGGEFHIRQNDWSTTTGKHLNWIDPDKNKRENAQVFENNLCKALLAHNLLQ